MYGTNPDSATQRAERLAHRRKEKKKRQRVNQRVNRQKKRDEQELPESRVETVAEIQQPQNEAESRAIREKLHSKLRARIHKSRAERLGKNKMEVPDVSNQHELIQKIQRNPQLARKMLQMMAQNKNQIAEDRNLGADINVPNHQKVDDDDAIAPPPLVVH